MSERSPAEFLEAGDPVHLNGISSLSWVTRMWGILRTLRIGGFLHHQVPGMRPPPVHAVIHTAFTSFISYKKTPLLDLDEDAKTDVVSISLWETTTCSSR